MLNWNLEIYIKEFLTFFLLFCLIFIAILTHKKIKLLETRLKHISNSSLKIKTFYWKLLYASILLFIALWKAPTLIEEYNTKQTVIFTIDYSASMKAEDIYPNRISYAIKLTKEIISKLPEESKIGLIGFSDRQNLLCPITTDIEAAKNLLDKTESDNLVYKGSNILTAINTSLNYAASFTEKNKNTSIILLTDGEQNLPYIIHRQDIKPNIFITIIASTEGSPIPDKSNKWLRDNDGQIVISHPNFKFLNLIQKNMKTKIIYIDKNSKHTKIAAKIYSYLLQNNQQQNREVPYLWKLFVILAIFFTFDLFFFIKKRNLFYKKITTIILYSFIIYSLTSTIILAEECEHLIKKQIHNPFSLEITKKLILCLSKKNKCTYAENMLNIAKQLKISEYDYINNIETIGDCYINSKDYLNAFHIFYSIANVYNKPKFATKAKKALKAYQKTQTIKQKEKSNNNQKPETKHKNVQKNKHNNKKESNNIEQDTRINIQSLNMKIHKNNKPKNISHIEKTKTNEKNIYW